MKIRGASTFEVSSPLTPAEILELTNSVLRAFRETHPAVLGAEAAFEDDEEVQVRLVLRATSYSDAEEAMASLVSDLADAFRAGGPATEFTGRATELVPA